MAADQAAGGRPKHPMVAGIMTGDTTDQAPLIQPAASAGPAENPASAISKPAIVHPRQAAAWRDTRDADMPSRSAIGWGMCAELFMSQSANANKNGRQRPFFYWTASFADFPVDSIRRRPR